MKRISLLFIPVIALMALAPLPALATGGGGGDGGDGSSKEQEDRSGFNTASAFFALFFQGRGDMFGAAIDIHLSSRSIDSLRSVHVETWAEESQRLFVEEVVKERKRKEAERQAQQDEWDKAAENWSDDLPGLDD